MGLGRRWTRFGLALGGLLFVFVVFTVLGNHHPQVPLLVHPSDGYVVDIAFRKCWLWNKNSALCGRPLLSDGYHNDEWPEGTQWVRVDKDLRLRTGWLSREYMSYKVVPSTYFKRAGDQIAITLVLVQHPEIPEEARLSVDDGWVPRPYGVWVRYEKPAAETVITALDVLYGEDAVDPRYRWDLAGLPLVSPPRGPVVPRLTARQGTGARDGMVERTRKLKFNSNGQFKILQVADLHFSTGVGLCRDPEPPQLAVGCEADPRTLRFLKRVIEIEKPDFVVLTGDQVMGDTSPDAITSLFKALNPFVETKIPFAVVMGNHDDEGSLLRAQMVELACLLDYSKCEPGPNHVSGVGNYVLTVESASSSKPGMAMYFVDAHKYLQQPKVLPGYDWIKEDQLEFMRRQHAKVSALGQPQILMAFFHIPLPEYRNVGNQFLMGKNPEGVTAPRYNSHARDVFAEFGVSVVLCGHDHANDYCLHDHSEANGGSDMWLCYGGGSGEGGYGGYGGYIRRLRIYNIDETSGSVSSWKRAENNPDLKFDEQILVKGGRAVSGAQ